MIIFEGELILPKNEMCDMNSELWFNNMDEMVEKHKTSDDICDKILTGSKQQSRYILNSIKESRTK